MRKILLASHGKLAKGMADSLHFFIGDEPELEYLCAYVDDTPIEQQIKSYFDGISPEDEVIIFTDLIGGSVNTKFIEYMNANSERKLHLIANMSLGLILEILMISDDSDIEVQIESALKKDRIGPVYVNHYTVICSSDDEL